MRLILLTGSGLAHRYVANRLAAKHALAATFVCHGTPRSRFQSARRLFRRYSTRQLLSRSVARVLAAAAGDRRTREAEILDVLGTDSAAFREPVRELVGLNSDASYEQIAAIRPDALLIYGTGIVGDRLLQLPEIALNMHTGISPHYRGHACSFWPLYNEELHRLGATVHECTPEVDGGQIFKVERARLERVDGVYSAFARCVQIGTELYVETVRELLSGTLRGEPQDLSIGREYRAAEKGWFEEWSVRRTVRAGLIRDFVDRERAGTSALLL